MESKIYPKSDFIDCSLMIPNPEKPGYLKEERRLTLDELKSKIEEYLKGIRSPKNPEEYSIFDELDYFNASFEKSAEVPRYRFLFNFSVVGGSEGYYFHVAIINNEGIFKNLITAKTLSSDPDLVNFINGAITYFING